MPGWQRVDSWDRLSPPCCPFDVPDSAPDALQAGHNLTETHRKTEAFSGLLLRDRRVRQLVPEIIFHRPLWLLIGWKSHCPICQLPTIVRFSSSSSHRMKSASASQPTSTSPPIQFLSISPLSTLFSSVKGHGYAIHQASAACFRTSFCCVAQHAFGLCVDGKRNGQFLRHELLRKWQLCRGGK